LQASWSSHVSGVPGTQPWSGAQVSTPLQALPSSHVSGVPGTQPWSGAQVSTPLQALPSSHVSGIPGTQPEAGLQVSTPLQALPSSQLMGECWHPSVVSQLSVVQASWSSQPMVLCLHPLDVSQLSVVQALLSSQFSVVPLQTLLEQTSPVVQAFPSSHELVFALLEHTAFPLQSTEQLSVVQTLLSSQFFEAHGLLVLVLTFTKVQVTSPEETVIVTLRPSTLLVIVADPVFEQLMPDSVQPETDPSVKVYVFPVVTPTFL